jgi:hypothetical protein
MIWVVLLVQVAVVYLLWDIRRALGVRGHPVPMVFQPAQKPSPDRPGFAGAIPPNRYVVVRWPQGRLEYQGASGASARMAYEHTPPAVGEEVEFWELGNRRGHKAG